MNKLTIKKILTKGLKSFFFSTFVIAEVTNVNAVTIETNVNSYEPIFEGIELATGYTKFTTDDPIELPDGMFVEGPFFQRVTSLRIDLENPDIQFFSTPSNGDLPLETNAQTTSEFLDEYDLQVAINANFFEPFDPNNPIVREPKDLAGLAISEGEIVSPSEDIFYGVFPSYSLLITEDNDAEITRTKTNDDFPNIFTAVSGSPRLLEDGEIVVAPDPDLTQIDFEILALLFAPRTAVGISEDEKSLILIVIDGRQLDFSIGATYYQTSEWLRLFGAYQGLNLDGGGSTTLVREDEFGDPQVLNRPSDGSERFVGNNFGVSANSLSQKVPEPSTTIALATVLSCGALLKKRNRGAQFWKRLFWQVNKYFFTGEQT
jgi:hypothetical protein